VKRTSKDCQVLAAAVMSELTQVAANMLFGILLATYRLRPDSMFWDIVERFLMNSEKENARTKISLR